VGGPGLTAVRAGGELGDEWWNGTAGEVEGRAAEGKKRRWLEDIGDGED
jgi:hypothetical protein